MSFLTASDGMGLSNWLRRAGKQAKESPSVPELLVQLPDIGSFRAVQWAWPPVPTPSYSVKFSGWTNLKAYCKARRRGLAVSVEGVTRARARTATQYLVLVNPHRGFAGFATGFVGEDSIRQTRRHAWITGQAVCAGPDLVEVIQAG